MTDEKFKELINEYGNEFLLEKDSDIAVYDMAEINDLGFSTEDALYKAFFGYRFGWEDCPFNPCDDYFTFSGYGNFVSIHKYDLEKYLCDNIDETDFIEWLHEMGYLEEEEEE